MSKKLLKLKQSRKPHIHDIRDLRLNREVKKTQSVLRTGTLLILEFFPIFQCKKIDNKSDSQCKFSFINPSTAHCFLKVLNKCRQFSCIDLLSSSKLVPLDGKKLICFIQNLLRNLMNFVSRSKNDRKCPKNS